MTKTSGFTEAELAAYEWSKRQKNLEKSDKTENKYSRRNRRTKEERRREEGSDDSSVDSFGRNKRRSSPGRHNIGVSPPTRGSKRYSRSISGSNPRRNSNYERFKKRTRYESESSRDSSISNSKHSSSSRESSNSRSRKYSSSRYREDLPKDPFNPLTLAYRRNNRSGPDRRLKEKEEREEEKWKHDLYESDGERACYEAEFRKKRIKQSVKESKQFSEDFLKLSERSPTSSESDSEKKPKLITKRGWQSRAGGVYIPGEEDDDLYYDYTRQRSPSYERPDPSYTLSDLSPL